MRHLALCCSLFAATALAHDLSVEVALNGTAPSEDDPRTGSLGPTAAGSYDLNDAWSLTGMAVYRRSSARSTCGEKPSKMGTCSTSGSTSPVPIPT